MYLANHQDPQKLLEDCLLIIAAIICGTNPPKLECDGPSWVNVQFVMDIWRSNPLLGRIIASRGDSVDISLGHIQKHVQY